MEQFSVRNSNIEEIAKRRIPLAIAVFITLLVISGALAVGLPAKYKSRAVILIEAQEIPQDLVRSLVTGFADQRIQVISQRVLTNSNLQAIIEKYNLYEDERQADPLEQVLENMRDDIGVQPIVADVVDQKSGKAIKATIAVEIAYSSKSPQIAQRVANELLSLFLNENLKHRTETADETLTFLDQETDKLRVEVADLEARLAEFKERNAGELPELMNLNTQLMNAREQDLLRLENQLQALEQQRVYLESEVAQQEPTTQLYDGTGQRVLAPADRLKILEAEYIPIVARYGDAHPDAVAMRKQLDSLRAFVGETGSASEIALSLQKKQAELVASEERYGKGHPDIMRIQREITALKERLDKANASAGIYTQAPTQTPDNPIYIQLKARLSATNTEIQSIRKQRDTIREQVAKFEQRLTNAPQVEREYRMLSRDYDIAQLKYQEVLAKRQEAKLAQSLESEQKGERFTLIEPPIVPEEPASPNRLAIGFVGFLLSVAGGVGGAAVAESVDSRVYGRNGVTRLLGVPPLAVIPLVENAATRRSRLRKKLMLAATVLLAFGFALLGIHLFFRPVDVLFYQVLRTIGI